VLYCTVLYWGTHSCCYNTNTNEEVAAVAALNEINQMNSIPVPE
jgi:hypothetical protein